MSELKNSGKRDVFSPLRNISVIANAGILSAIAIILGFFKIPVTQLIEIRFAVLPLWPCCGRSGWPGLRYRRLYPAPYRSLFPRVYGYISDHRSDFRMHALQAQTHSAPDPDGPDRVHSNLRHFPQQPLALHALRERFYSGSDRENRQRAGDDSHQHADVRGCPAAREEAGAGPDGHVPAVTSPE